MFHIPIYVLLHSTFAAAAVPQCDPRTMCACLPDVSTPLDETAFLQIESSLVQARPAVGNRSRDSASWTNGHTETARTMHAHEVVRLDRMALTTLRNASRETFITGSFASITKSLSQIKSQTGNADGIVRALGMIIAITGVIAFVAVGCAFVDWPMDDDDLKHQHVLVKGPNPYVEHTFENLPPPPSLGAVRPSSTASSPAVQEVRPQFQIGKAGGAETLLYSSTRPASAPVTTLEPIDGDVPDPPPICPQLIVPNRRVKFFVPWKHFQGGSPGGRIEVMGASGRTLLFVEMAMKSGYSCFSISLKGFQTEPVMTVLSMGPKSSQEVFGDSTDPYGILESVEPSGRLLMCGGRPVLRIQLHDREALRFTATTMNGELLGTSNRMEATSGSDAREEFWKAEVEAGQDGVLIVGCMIATILQATDRLA